jgi:hypothetical protein
MKYLFIIIVLISLNLFAQDTVVIIDENGEPQICKVTESGAIVCL